MKLKNITFFAVFLFSMGTLASAQSGPSADDYLKAADDLYKNAKQDDAIANYEKAAQGFENSGNIERFVYSYNQIGVILTRQDKYEKARTYLDKALSTGLESLGPNDLTVAATFLALGVVYSAEGQFERSLGAHRKALDIRLAKLGKFDSNVATSYGNIGNVHLRNKDYDKAIEAHKLAMEIRAKVFGEKGPEIVESYRGLGNAYREKKDYKLSLKYFEKALSNKVNQLGPGHKDLARFYRYVSEVHSLAGNRSKADEYRLKAEEVEK
ncbi:MAG: tetratricopeptide repeat protein [Pyrinomonadaceae bacterium]